MTTVVFAAHPDDEVLGCGGTIARRSEEGESIHVIVLGEGATARERVPDPARAGVGELSDQSHHAAAILGAAGMRNLGLPDNRFDSVDLLDVVRLAEAVLDELRPDVVLTHHPGDTNIDHQVTFRAVLAATRPVGGHSVRDVLTFEVGSSTEWSFAAAEAQFRPQLFMDISATLERKVEALGAYAGEVRTFPHPRSPEALRAWAAARGSTAGVPAAEAFGVIRLVR